MTHLDDEEPLYSLELILGSSSFYLDSLYLLVCISRYELYIQWAIIVCEAYSRVFELFVNFISVGSKCEHLSREEKVFREETPLAQVMSLWRENNFKVVAPRLLKLVAKLFCTWEVLGKENLYLTKSLDIQYKQERLLVGVQCSLALGLCERSVCRFNIPWHWVLVNEIML